jgi:hypothetical protein
MLTPVTDAPSRNGPSGAAALVGAGYDDAELR